MPTGPPDPSPPVEADFGTTVSTPSPASAPSSTAYSSAPHGNTQATHTARDTTKINKWGPRLAHAAPVRTAQVGSRLGAAEAARMSARLGAHRSSVIRCQRSMLAMLASL